MEVTNNNSNTFAPKLGNVSSDSFSTESFSSHLVESQPQERARADEPHEPAEERTHEADRANAAEDDREAEARDRDRDDEERDSADRNAQDDTAAAADDGDETAVALAAVTETTEMLDGEDVSLVEEGEAIADTGLSGDLGASDTSVADGDETLAAGPDDADDTNTLPGDASVLAADDTDDTATAPVTGLADTGEAAEDAAADAARAASAANIAAADATAGDQARTNAAQSQTATNQGAKQDAALAANAVDEDGGLPNPLETNLDADTDTDGDGKRGLGHQAAEAMAGKNKAGSTGPAAATATQTPTFQAAASILQAAPVQTLAAIGLNTSSLPADFNLDLLNLNAAGQSTGSPQNSNPVLVRFGALPGQAQATQVPNTAIALQIAKHVSNGVSRFEIRLDPPEMGRIDVKLELAQDGRVSAHLSVEKAETLDLLQRDAKALEQALRDAGLDADADTLNFSLQNGDPGEAGEGQEAGADAENGNGEAEEDARSGLIAALAARQIEAAARGGVDVSI